MTNAKRGRGSHRGVYLCAAAALGFALSGCGGGGGGSGAAATASTSQAATSTVGTSAVGTSAASTPSGAGSSTAASAPPTASSSAVTLNWNPPTENTDGTPLTNLSGYDIHYGTSSGSYTQTITVSNPGIATYVVDNLTPGTYYFSVAAINSQGIESPLSPQVSTTVN
jgi:hypothetical protein